MLLSSLPVFYIYICRLSFAPESLDWSFLFLFIFFELSFLIFFLVFFFCFLTFQFVFLTLTFPVDFFLTVFFDFF